MTYVVGDKVEVRPAPGFENEGHDYYIGVVKQIRYEQNTPIYEIHIDLSYDLPFHKIEVTEDNILGYHSVTLH